VAPTANVMEGRRSLRSPNVVVVAEPGVVLAAVVAVLKGATSTVVVADARVVEVVSFVSEGDRVVVGSEGVDVQAVATNASTKTKPIRITT